MTEAVIPVMANQSRAVQFDQYGGIDVLEVRDVPRPQAGPGEVLVQVKAAAINPGEAMIRKGVLHDRWPSTFPSGQGSDFAGVVADVGDDAGEITAKGFAVGDDVLGFTDSRASQAEFVVVPAGQLTAKPAAVSWDVAGALYVAGTTAYAAVDAVRLTQGDVVAIAGAAGGVGTIAVQLAVKAGATVLGIAGPSNDQWLTEHGAVPVNYGDGLADRLRGIGRIDAFLDFFGGGYVDLAVTDLGIAPDRVDTIIDFAAVERFGVKAAGNAEGNTAMLAELAELIAAGQLEVPIAGTFPLDEVRQAYQTLEARHTRGKLVLRP